MPLTFNLDPAKRMYAIGPNFGDTFAENGNYKGLALTIEIKDPDEAQSLLLLYGDNDAKYGYSEEKTVTGYFQDEPRLMSEMRCGPFMARAIRGGDTVLKDAPLLLEFFASLLVDRHGHSPDDDYIQAAYERAAKLRAALPENRE